MKNILILTGIGIVISVVAMAFFTIYVVLPVLAAAFIWSHI